MLNFCRDVCHPDKVPSMKGVINTMVCEQTNSDVVCYKNSTKQMNCARYNFFFLYYSTIEIKVSWMELKIRVMIIIKKG